MKIGVMLKVLALCCVFSIVNSEALFWKKLTAPLTVNDKTRDDAINNHPEAIKIIDSNEASLKHDDHHHWQSLKEKIVGADSNPDSNTMSGILTKLRQEFTVFKQGFNKMYTNIKEESKRFLIFAQNFLLIETHNKEYDAGKKSFKLGVNHFTDMTNEEFRKTMNGFKSSQKLKGATYLPPENSPKPPVSVDWRNKGYVTPVKNQGQCGSCYTFSTTGSLEGQHYKKTNKLLSLSEEQIVACSSEFGNNGCNGGTMDNSFRYIIKVGGIELEKDYPYTSGNGAVYQCAFNQSHVRATVTGFVDIKQGNETDLQDALAHVGPVSIAIDASNPSFQLYSSGVYDEPNCSNNLDHGVLAVGYGVTDDDIEYYWVKNSWGVKWGDHGYIKMSRNKNNQCGIANMASYPLV